MKIMIVLATAFAASLSVGCKKERPSQPACEAAIQNMLEIWSREDPAAAQDQSAFERMMPGLVDQCVKSYSADKVQCLTAATSKTDADGC